MAEMMEKDTGGKKGPGVKKSKKVSTRVDLTPMVDLGFLLITFFIFTITMQEPTALKLNMPKKSDDKQETKIKETGSLTLLLGKGNVIYYYYGQDPTAGKGLQTTTYKQVRDVILAKKKATPPEDLFIVIKPDKDALYKNAVDILDEMSINDIPRYAMVDATQGEYDLIKKIEEKNGMQ